MLARVGWVDKSGKKSNSESGPARRPLCSRRLPPDPASSWVIFYSPLPRMHWPPFALFSFFLFDPISLLFFSICPFCSSGNPPCHPSTFPPRHSHATATAFTTLHPFFLTNAGHRPRICIVNPSSITCHDPTHDHYFPKHTIIHSRPIRKIKRCYYVHQERREYRFSPLSSLSSRPVCLC